MFGVTEEAVIFMANSTDRKLQVISTDPMEGRHKERPGGYRNLPSEQPATWCASCVDKPDENVRCRSWGVELEQPVVLELL